MKHFYSILYFFALVLFLLSTAISVPIYVRSFYYAQIESLEIEEYSGYSKKQIKEAYDDVLDYLTLHKKFGTGDLPHSAEGKAHFRDCQRLFDANLAIFAVSAAILLVLSVLEKTKKIQLAKLCGFHPGFFAGIFAVVLPLLLVGICAINFEKAFEIFHKIFFPGKTNWQFSSETDAIIDILPIEFFRNCAILIVSVLVFCSSIVVVTSILKRKKELKNK